MPSPEAAAKPSKLELTSTGLAPRTRVENGMRRRADPAVNAALKTLRRAGLGHVAVLVHVRRSLLPIYLRNATTAVEKRDRDTEASGPGGRAAAAGSNGRPSERQMSTALSLVRDRARFFVLGELG